MFTKFAVWTNVSVLSLASLLVSHSAAQQPSALSSPPAAPRTFQQLFRVGQFLTYTSTNNGYSLTLYTATQKKESEARYQEELTVYEKQVKDQELLDAKRRELANALSNADPEDQPAILAEIQAIGGVVERGGHGRGGFGNVQVAAEALRNVDRDQRRRTLSQLAGFGNRSDPPRRPRATSLYRVSEVGADFLCLVRDNRRLFIPVWSICSVTSEVIAEHDNVGQED